MISLDLPTVFIICASFIFLYGIGMTAFACKVSPSFKSIYLFAAINFLIAIGVSLTFLRNHISVFWSIIVSQSLLTLASTLVYQAHLQFIEHEKKSQFLSAILLITVISLIVLFTYHFPNSQHRILSINSFHFLQFSLTAWATWRWQRQQGHSTYTPLIVISAIFALTIAYRIFTIATSPYIPPYALQGTLSHSLQTIILMLYVATLDFSIVLITTGHLVKKVEQLADIDILTTLYNRRGLDHALEKDAIRTKPLCVIMCDIDHFKLVNDRYGHAVGDIVIQKFAHIIEESTRKTDICVRWGGEEFLIILPVSNPEDAFLVAEKIRTCCEKQLFPQQPELCFTSSFGISCKTISQNFDTIVNNADKALYRAKTQGRNQVCVFNEAADNG
jgi:diguanylate cyclase (GGDEF)-like protein